MCSMICPTTISAGKRRVSLVGTLAGCAKQSLEHGDAPSLVRPPIGGGHWSLAGDTAGKTHEKTGWFGNVRLGSHADYDLR